VSEVRHGAGGQLYESGLLDGALGGLMRPGGLALTERALGFCGLPAGARVLDVGCGLGASVEYLRQSLGLNAVGVDSSRAVVERGRQRCPGLPLIRGSGALLPFGSGTADAVLLECSLSAARDRSGLLAECSRVLAPAGKLAVSDLYLRGEKGPSSEEALSRSCAAGIATREQLASSLAAEGFQIALWEDHSRALCEFLAALIFHEGSLDGFWRCQCERPSQLPKVKEAMRRMRPGYCLLVATKRAGSEKEAKPWVTSRCA